MNVLHRQLSEHSDALFAWSFSCMLHKAERFLLVSIIPKQVSDQTAFRELKELKSLVDTFGGTLVDFVIQKREVHDKGSYLGAGKIAEVSDLIERENISHIVLNAAVKPGQLHDMKLIFHKKNPEIKVWDRVDLILEIFAKHASTAEARLQIELAAMRHMGPRIYGMGHILSRQGGSIGTRGIGETNTELMKRHWRAQMKKTQDKLQKLAEERHRQLQRRQRIGLATVSLIGYTNAGKTSLFNMLSGKEKKVANALFATLDSTVAKVFLPVSKREFLISDTIGFIQNLPTKLIDAFKSTLMESLSADMLLHVVDISDPDSEQKIATVTEILHELGIQHKKTLFIFTKIDALSKEELNQLKHHYALYQPHWVSVKTGEGIPALRETIGHNLTQSNGQVISSNQI